MIEKNERNRLLREQIERLSFHESVRCKEKKAEIKAKQISNKHLQNQIQTLLQSEKGKRLKKKYQAKKNNVNKSSGRQKFINREKQKIR